MRSALGCTAPGVSYGFSGQRPRPAGISGTSPQHTTCTHIHTHARIHTLPRGAGAALPARPPHPKAPCWLRDICYCVSSSPRPDGGPAGRGLPGGCGREECAPTPSPIWPPSRPICFPLPDAATAGPTEPARRGVKFMWPGPEPAVTGPHTLTQTHIGHTPHPPAPALMCVHTRPPFRLPPNPPTFSHPHQHQRLPPEHRLHQNTPPTKP